MLFLSSLPVLGNRDSLTASSHMELIDSWLPLDWSPRRSCRLGNKRGSQLGAIWIFQWGLVKFFGGWVGILKLLDCRFSFFFLQPWFSNGMASIRLRDNLSQNCSNYWCDHLNRVQRNKGKKPKDWKIFWIPLAGFWAGERGLSCCQVTH